METQWMIFFRTQRPYKSGIAGERLRDHGICCSEEKYYHEGKTKSIALQIHKEDFNIVNDIRIKNTTA